MRLYHGTSISNGERIITDGIRPRNEVARSNYEEALESRTDAVYLTSCYPGPYADQAAGDNDGWCIIEIEANRLDPLLFLPDEDFLVASHNFHRDQISQQTYQSQYGFLMGAYKRQSHLCRRLWRKSLRWYGTCAYRGVIPIHAFTKVSFFHNANKCPELRRYWQMSRSMKANLSFYDLLIAFMFNPTMDLQLMHKAMVDGIVRSDLSPDSREAWEATFLQIIEELKTSRIDVRTFSLRGSRYMQEKQPSPVQLVLSH